MNKRIISALLALVMVLSLTACGKSTPSSAQNDNEQITLTLGVNGKANVTEWDNNKLVLWLEETTGYNIDVQVFSGDAAERATQVSTIVAGGEKLPDVMFYFSLSDEAMYTYGSDGYLANLLPYFSEEHMAKFSVEYDEAFGFEADLHPKNIIDNKKFEIKTPDVSIKVAPDRSDLIETRVIGGVKYIMICADEDVEVNGVSIHIGDKEPATV